MERQQILATMGELKLFGMKAAYDEIIKIAVKRTHEPQQIVDLPGGEELRLVEREQLDPLAYAELWVRDGGTAPGVTLVYLDLARVADARRRVPAWRHDPVIWGP